MTENIFKEVTFISVITSVSISATLYFDLSNFIIKYSSFYLSKINTLISASNFTERRTNMF